jgi:type VI secretion system protein ImpM
LEPFGFCSVRGRPSARIFSAIAGFEDFEQTLYEKFIQAHTLADLASLLCGTAHAVSVPKILLALGSQLQSMYTLGAHKTIRTLALLLPTDPHSMHLVATLWMDLIAGFLKETHSELCIFITTHHEQPTLVVDLEGASPQSLCAAIGGHTCQRDASDISRTPWMDICLDDNPSLLGLANALRDPTIPLASALTLFHKTFFGE